MSTLRDLRRCSEAADGERSDSEWPSVERSRRMRDAVEAALSDIILLGTEEQVQLAATAAADLAAGRPTPTDALVVSLRDFIRRVLDLEPISPRVAIPKQGPARLSAGGKGGGGAKDDAGKGGGAKGMGGGAGGMGMGAGVADEEGPGHHPA